MSNLHISNILCHVMEYFDIGSTWSEVEATFWKIKSVKRSFTLSAQIFTVSSFLHLFESN